jgi:uncharacterized protein YcfL
MKKYHSSLLLVLCVSLVGCADHNAEKVVRLNNPDNIKIVDMRSVKTNGLLAVAVTLQNTSSSTDTIQYRFKWLTNSGFAAGNEEAWLPQLIYSEQSVQVRGVASNPSVTDFSFELSH